MKIRYKKSLSAICFCFLLFGCIAKEPVKSYDEKTPPFGREGSFPTEFFLDLKNTNGEFVGNAAIDMRVNGKSCRVFPNPPGQYIAHLDTCASPARDMNSSAIIRLNHREYEPITRKLLLEDFYRKKITGYKIYLAPKPSYPDRVIIELENPSGDIDLKDFDVSVHVNNKKCLTSPLAQENGIFAVDLKSCSDPLTDSSSSAKITVTHDRFIDLFYALELKKILQDRKNHFKIRLNPTPKIVEMATTTKRKATKESVPEDAVIVAKDGSGDRKTIQLGIDMLGSDKKGKSKTVYLTKGTYIEDVIIDKPVTLTGAKGTIVEGTINIMVNEGDVEIAGIETKGSVNVDGYAGSVRFDNMRMAGSISGSAKHFDLNNSAVEGDLQIKNGVAINSCKIVGNLSTADAKENNIVRNSHIEGNLSINNSAILVEYCRVSNSEGDGISLRNSSAVLKNNLIANNQGVGVTAYSSNDHTSVLLIQNNIVFGNGKDGIHLSGDSLYRYRSYTHEAGIIKSEIRNNIIAKNSGIGIAAGRGNVGVENEYNNLYGNTEGDYSGVSKGRGERNLDPMFVDPENGDFRLKSNSPMIETGKDGIDMGVLWAKREARPDFPKNPKKPEKREDYPKIPVEIKRPAELIFEEVKLVDENGSNRLNKDVVEFKYDEVVVLTVKFKNVGELAAENVGVNLKGDSEIVGLLTKKTPHIPKTLEPGGSVEVTYAATVPREVTTPKGCLSIRLQEKEKRVPPIRTIEFDLQGKLHEAPKRYNRFAVVVGISKYRHFDGPKYAENDAARFKKLLTTVGGMRDHENNIKYLTGTDGNATGNEIRNALQWLLEKDHDNPDAELIFYFSGEGGQKWDKSHKEIIDGYIVPLDAKEGNISDETCIPVKKKLIATLEKAKTDKILVVLDSCFNGQGVKSRSNKKFALMGFNIIEPGEHSGKVLLISAAEGDQAAEEYKEYGLFSLFFFEGLEGAADRKFNIGDGDSKVSAMEAFKYALKKIKGIGKPQTPEISSSKPFILTTTGQW